MAATTITTTNGKMLPAAQLPNEQEQSKAPAVQSDPNIDMLQSMMNLILIQSGRFIKEHQAGGGTGRMKLSMQRAVPIATERFHDALDELENKIYLANTILRRDLALEKEKRKRREAAAKEHEAQRARQAAEAKNAPPPQPLKEEEEPMSVEKVASPVAVEDTSKAPNTASPVKEEQLDLKRDDSHVPPPIKTDKDEPPQDPLFDATPTTVNPQESDFDFEAMFGDSAMDTGGDNNHDDMMMDMTGDMGFSLDDGNDGPSLLRGLEDLAKSGDDSNNAQDAMDLDLPMPDLPDLNNAAESQPTAAPEPETKKEPTPKAETPKAAAPPPPAPEPAVETKVEDNNNSANDMMATMAVDDLEDLFNMDEYENPENSSFDDAFFNFE